MSVRFIIERLMQALLTMLMLSIIVFGLSRLTGDPINLMAPMEASPEDIARIKASLGLDKPLLTQYWIYISNAIQGDFGQSIKWDRSAAQMLLERFPATVVLSITSMALG